MAEQAFIQRWKKRIVIAVLLLAALIATSYYVYGMLNTGQLNPIALLAVAAVISIGLPMLRSNFFPSRRDCETEYAFHEQRLEKEITQALSDGIGQAANRIFSTPGQYREAADEAIGPLLARGDLTRNPDVHFALLMALARYNEKIGDPASAIPVLQKALKIKPQHFVARMHLAGNYEWVGAVEEARQQYGQLLDDRQTLSRGMQKLVILRRNALGNEKTPEE